MIPEALITVASSSDGTFVFHDIYHRNYCHAAAASSEYYSLECECPAFPSGWLPPVLVPPQAAEWRYYSTDIGSESPGKKSVILSRQHITVTTVAYNQAEITAAGVLKLISISSC